MADLSNPLAESHSADANAVLAQVTALLEAARPHVATGSPAAQAAFAAAAAACASADWTVLVAGLRSVGKSSFVCALWGDSELLPTAVRDCTQSNTLVRVPVGAETDRTLQLAWLPRDRALEFATRGLAFHRIDSLLDELLGPVKPRFGERPPAEQLHGALETIHALFRDRRDLAILHEPVTEQIEQLREFLAFVETPEFQPGRTVTAAWDARRDFLMGQRGPDGRTVAVGRLLALRQVEILRRTAGWGAVRPPRLFDTPWVPKFHNARRAELILEQARQADLIVLLALPERLEPEEWLEKLLSDQPDIGRRTLVIFNQIDTIDTLSLFRRDGFAEQFEQNIATLRRLHIPAENLRISCARRPFLQAADATADVAARLKRLEHTLGEIRRAAEKRGETPIAARLIEATDESGGLQPIRDRLVRMQGWEVVPARARAALAALVAVEDRLPADLRQRLTALQMQVSPVR